MASFRRPAGTPRRGRRRRAAGVCLRAAPMRAGADQRLRQGAGLRLPTPYGSPVWGQPLGGFQVGPARGPVTALVDGAVFGGDPRDIPLNAHSAIQLDVGATVPFQPYRFAAGL